MVEYSIFLMVVFVAHFLGDFVFQTEAMATQKSKSLEALLSHISVYGMTLLLATTLLSLLGIGNPLLLLYWVALNTALHFLVDFTTSRVNSYLVSKYGMTHNFFVGIGADQLLHTLILVATTLALFLT